ncbi:MAG TPA: alpha/beta fold hydrolase [Patescibacteria group bacterium]|nr:alpha/beta fold hydrolase [Patescibacteria group bacterium]
MTTEHTPPPQSESVTSKDGTKIGYLKYGDGSSGILLVQGTMGSVENFRELAENLADTFIVYAVERRGRGISGPTGTEYGIGREVEDLEAVLNKTKAENVFGLSSGAIISLEAARRLSSIKKLAIFEPPLLTSATLPRKLLDRYRSEIHEDKTAAALVTAMQAGQFGPPIMKYMPRWLLVAFVNKIMAAEEKAGSGNYISMRKMAPIIQNDFQLVEEMCDKMSSFGGISSEMLLLSGTKSPAYLRTATDSLAKLLPHATRIDLPNLGHSAAWNFDKQRNPDGAPNIVAEKLRNFFV